MLRQSWHLRRWKFICWIGLQKEKIRSHSGELPFPPTSFNSRGWEATLLVRVILHQGTRSSGKDYPASLISNSDSLSELNLWVIERLTVRLRKTLCGRSAMTTDVQPELTITVIRYLLPMFFLSSK